MLDFDCDGDKQVAEHKGYTITVEHDTFSENPWKDWDYMPPLYVYDGTFGDINGGSRYIGNSVNILDELLEMTTDKQLESIKDKISDVYELDEDEDLRENIENNRGDKEEFRYIKLLCNLHNIKYKTWTSCGYSQGEELDCIMVALPDFIKETGIKNKDIAKSLDNDAIVADAWFWGDIYEYIIEDKHGEQIDSCSGYYGMDFIKSGLEKTVIDEINADIAKRRFDVSIKIYTTETIKADNEEEAREKAERRMENSKFNGSFEIEEKELA